MRFSLCQWPPCISMRCSARSPPPLFPRITVLSAQHLSPELSEKSRASSRRPDPPRCLLWDYGAEGVGVRGELSRGRLRRQLRERGSHGKGPPKAWNASEVSRGWSRGGPEELSRDGAGAFVQAVRHQRRDGAEKVSAGAVKQVPLLFFWLGGWASGCRGEGGAWLPCSGVIEVTFCTWMGSKGRRLHG